MFGVLSLSVPAMSKIDGRATWLKIGSGHICVIAKTLTVDVDDVFENAWSEFSRPEGMLQRGNDCEAVRAVRLTKMRVSLTGGLVI